MGNSILIKCSTQFYTRSHSNGHSLISPDSVALEFCRQYKYLWKDLMRAQEVNVSKTQIKIPESNSGRLFFVTIWVSFERF